MTEIFNVFKNEFKKVFVDKGSVLVMIVGFFLYGLFYIIPFSGDILTHVPIGVVDQDNTSFSRELTRSIDSSELVDVKYKIDNLNEAKKLFYENKIKAYVLIPKGFEKNILNGRYSTIASYEDTAYMIIYKQVATSILTIATTMGAKLEIGGLMKKGLSLPQAMATRFPFEYVENPLYNPIGSYQNYVIPLVLVLVLQQTLLLGAGMLCATDREKIKGLKVNEDGNIQFLQEPYCKFSENPYKIVLGKSLAYFSIYFLYGIICLYIYPSFVIYNSFYNFTSLCFVVLFLFSVAFFAQTLLYFYERRESPIFVLLPTSLPFIFMTGFIWPRSAIPGILNFLSLFIPSVSYTDAIVKMNQMGASFYQMKHDFVILALLCIMYYFTAVMVTKGLVKNSKI